MSDVANGAKKLSYLLKSSNIFFQELRKILDENDDFYKKISNLIRPKDIDEEINEYIAHLGVKELKKLVAEIKRREEYMEKTNP